ncbi:conserved protein of unknown function containing TadE-like domain [Magnetospirillum gryphiswaldense MSR-1 v2]|uniref:TadE-like domain-containing protein n=1 Tax=Magnetospirillum gryphiswaldense (strain DSM 6361 / JCM 21280 / NBRC 15271 / MSR-1) TaxID=431944 RepID=V6F047_MAGGM|nr:TadE/TadG family type IV pilus assembly protein [Magnetospirillum gryphiswaldense]CDK98829.1 conserved protein of unknown function containing TadE-like domain [Magnetospirillum gryphiswaldense MSR-1 v2]
MSPAARMLARLRRDRAGIAATEFALILPVMVLMLVGMAEVFGLVQAYGKALSAAQVVSDLTSRADSQSTASMNGIVTGAQRVLDPLPSGADRLGIRVASVGISSAGQPVQLWTYSWGGAAPAVAIGDAAGLAPNGQSVIMVTLRYTHPPLLQAILGSLSLNHSVVSRPRLVRLIPFNGSTGTLP